MLEKIGLPEKPSLRGNNWVVDATHCQGCSSQFTFINRKHHCRRCGGIFCSSCTQQRMVLRGQGDSPVRICDPCKKLEEAARFEMRHGRRGGRGSLKVASRSEDEILNQLLSNDVKDSSGIQVGTSQDGEEDSGQSLSSNETSHDAGCVSPQELRQQALDEKTKYKLLKGEGKSAEALKAFKRAKELERQAAAVELQLRKDRKKSLASSTMAEIKKSENSSPDSSGKEQPSRQKGKGKDDLTAELKALGWSDMDLHDVDRKPASASIESELFNLMGKKLNTAHQDKGAHGIDKSQVVALKKNALKLKREGNLVEAKEVLKRAKILEKELEEQELLGDAEDSDDELSALVKSLDSFEQGDLPLGYELSHTFDYDNLTDYAGDIDIDGNFEVTEDDMDDPELAATLKSLGWTEDSTQHEESLRQSVSIDREGLVGEILNMKREAVNQKRIGNISEATSLLKKAKLLEKDLDSIDSHYSPTSSTQHQNADKTSELRGEGARNAGKEINTAPKSRLVIQRELLGLKKKALALRREGKINEAEEELKKGKILEQQLEDIDNASKMKVSEVNIRHEVRKTCSKLPDIPTDLGSIDEEGGDITDQDLRDPTYLALLRNLGWQDEDNEHASSSSEVLKQTTHLSTGSTDASFSGLTIVKPRSKADIQRELLALKRKALALRRQGQSAEAEKLLNTAKELEAQISELDAPSLADNSEHKIMVEAPEEQAVFNISEERGNETAVPPLSQPSEPINARNTSEQMTSAVTDKDNVSPLVSANSLQQEILSHKRKAIGFKREGKLAEAREELKKAKLLERGLTEEKPQTLTNSSIAEVSTPVTTVTQKESWPENVAPKPMTSQERFKLQRECLTHKRNALKLRRDGQTEEAEAELQLARSLETQLEEAAGSDAGSSSKVRVTDDAVVDDLLDPQILSALKAIGLQDTSAVSQAQVRVEPTQVKAETLVPGAGQNSNSNEEKAHLEAQIKAEKLKALNLKRSGKQAEALDALRRAKQLEKKCSLLPS